MTRPGPRERLLAATSTLSYTEGVGVGLDAILRTADVARRSVYQHFGGKDNLLAETIGEASRADLDMIAERMDRAGTDPRARLLAFLDFYLDRSAQTYFRGCRFVAADLGLPDPEHPVHVRTRLHYERMRDFLMIELSALGHPDGAGAADRLQLIVEGMLAQRGTRPGAGPEAAARALFEQVLEER
ncbi:TetR/AcrR family transcriptional regulator [Kutzneria buriramensis]|uniref:AcrR family transcriptional regulator n=1 Tax=Kutzneria buriramensis TaxID=1045776 RepID=A0A3E0HFN1_9PSEU|nr:TetR/AcrR family transcriptional regulator [Kutzneria buriramensis]REH44541.1 AcrR family transcriptional regulator [Kutzneria buriramensis]